ncbi:hypothetical protein KAU19_08365 [Candidatus Parcubacteria bacterium]|nr:hypothetical protein [Candidatus Parcubacteria bacterium]
MKLRDFFVKSIWKLKAIKRAKEINSLKKRIKELVISRDKTKIKNDNLKIKNKELEERITKLKYELKKN